MLDSMQQADFKQISRNFTQIHAHFTLISRRSLGGIQAKSSGILAESKRNFTGI